VAAVGATLGATAACSRVSVAAKGEGGDLLQRLRAQGTVRLGIEDEPPLSSIDKNGRLTGCDPEIARRIFRRLGVPHVQPQPIEFNSLIAGLDSQQFDVIAAGMYITPKRCEKVLFADPHYEMTDEFIVPRGNPKKLHTYRDVADRGATLATVEGYAEVGFARSAGVEHLVTVGTLQDGVDRVEQKRADAFSTTTVTIRDFYYHRNRSSAVEYAQPFNPLPHSSHLPGGGFAFRKEETKLRDAFNDELNKMKKSGELVRLMRRFHFVPEEVSSQTAKELCG